MDLENSDDFEMESSENNIIIVKEFHERKL